MSDPEPLNKEIVYYCTTALWLTERSLAGEDLANDAGHESQHGQSPEVHLIPLCEAWLAEGWQPTTRQHSLLTAVTHKI